MTPFRAKRVTDPEHVAEWEQAIGEREILDEKGFARLIALERKRTERTEEPFLLMLLEAGDSLGEDFPLEGVAQALLAHSRETDVLGWYKGRRTLGVLYTTLERSNPHQLQRILSERLQQSLKQESFDGIFDLLRLSFHLFPDNWEHMQSAMPSDAALYPDLHRPGHSRRVQLFCKRLMDVLVSAALLLVLLPVFVAIALAVKLTSKGPVFFRQKRVGQYGRLFTFLKFRSMYENNDHSVHKEFIRRFIKSGAAHHGARSGAEPVYKLTGDKRITPVGGFLRRSSLDELPQLINVLMGEMSLVGPRPAILYEVEAYQTWHRRRVLEARPGITGLWQVAGRSRVKFDDMVRMDLRYAASWNLWIDLKILLQTPLAVFRGTGAY